MRNACQMNALLTSQFSFMVDTPSSGGVQERDAMQENTLPFISFLTFLFFFLNKCGVTAMTTQRSGSVYIFALFTDVQNNKLRSIEPDPHWTIQFNADPINNLLENDHWGGAGEGEGLSAFELRGGRCDWWIHGFIHFRISDGKVRTDRRSPGVPAVPLRKNVCVWVCAQQSPTVFSLPSTHTHI